MSEERGDLPEIEITSLEVGAVRISCGLVSEERRHGALVRDMWPEVARQKARALLQAADEAEQCSARYGRR